MTGTPRAALALAPADGPEVVARAEVGVARPQVPAWAASTAVIAALATLNIAKHLFGGGLWLGPLAAVALVTFARWTGLTWGELGLARSALRSGWRWALLAVSVVATIYLVGILVPVTRSAFLDARYHLPLRGALLSAFVVIPVGTVLAEEVAFRSVLWATLTRQSTTGRALVLSSALFGLWHVLPSMHLASANQGVGDVASAAAGGSATVVVVTASVAFTAVGGAVAGELRRRSGSLVASIGMHWATNGLGVLFGLVAWHLAA